MTLLYAYYAATLCKKPEQTYERILRSRNNERTNGRTNGSEFVGPNSAPRGTKKGFQSKLGQTVQEMLILGYFW